MASAEKIQIEVVEDHAFPTMGGDGAILAVQNSDAVAATSPGSSNMEEARILVRFHCQANVEALAPVGKFLGLNVVQTLDGNASQLLFVGVQFSLLLEKVQSINQDFGVIFPLSKGEKSLRLGAAGTTAMFKHLYKVLANVARIRSHEFSNRKQVLHGV